MCSLLASFPFFARLFYVSTHAFFPSPFAVSPLSLFSFRNFSFPYVSSSRFLLPRRSCNIFSALFFVCFSPLFFCFRCHRRPENLFQQRFLLFLYFFFCFRMFFCKFLWMEKLFSFSCSSPFRLYYGFREARRQASTARLTFLFVLVSLLPPRSLLFRRRIYWDIIFTSLFYVFLLLRLLSALLSLHSGSLCVSFRFFHSLLTFRLAHRLLFPSYSKQQHFISSHLSLRLLFLGKIRCNLTFFLVSGFPFCLMPTCDRLGGCFRSAFAFCSRLPAALEFPQRASQLGLMNHPKALEYSLPYSRA